MRVQIDSRSPQQTLRLGRALGRLLEGGEVLGIAGELGAGKTQFVRGMAQGLDIDPDVIYSPSFTLVAEHEGRLRLNHIDLFRLGERVKPSDEEEIGLTEYLDPAGVTAIEWYRKLDQPAAGWSLEIDIAVLDGDRRTISFEGRGEPAQRILAALERDSSWH